MATRFFSTAASVCCDNYLESAVWLTIWLVNAGYRPVGKENFSPINKAKSGHGSAVSLQLILGRWFSPPKGDRGRTLARATMFWGRETALPCFQLLVKKPGFWAINYKYRVNWTR
jgi:hypothetical protein